MMEEKMMQVRNDHPRRSQKRRRKRFPWGDIAATLLVAAICAYVFLSFGEKTPEEGKCQGGVSMQKNSNCSEHVVREDGEDCGRG